MQPFYLVVRTYLRLLVVLGWCRISHFRAKVCFDPFGIPGPWYTLVRWAVGTAAPTLCPDAVCAPRPPILVGKDEKWDRESKYLYNIYL
jgi:hypothetical protein